MSCFGKISTSIEFCECLDINYENYCLGSCISVSYLISMIKVDLCIRQWSIVESRKIQFLLNPPQRKNWELAHKFTTYQGSSWTGAWGFWTTTDIFKKRSFILLIIKFVYLISSFSPPWITPWHIISATVQQHIQDADF